MKNSRQREQNNLAQPEGIAIDHPTEPIANANNIAIDSTRRDLDDSNLPIPPGVVQHDQDDVLPNANHQPRGDIMEFHQSSERNQSAAMARPRLQTRAEMLMPRRHYDAMIKARAAEERNNILRPDIMVIECTEHAVQQSRQSQAHANNMAVYSTRRIIDDSIVAIPPIVTPQAEDSILQDDTVQINDSTQRVIDDRGETITQRVMPNTQDGVLPNDIRQPTDLSISNGSLDESYVYNSDDQSLFSDSSSSDDSQLNDIPNEDKLNLWRPEGHDCSLCLDTHHLHDTALSTF